MQLVADQKIESAIADRLLLFREIGDLKRLYSFRTGADSFATAVFRACTQSVVDGSALHSSEWVSFCTAAARLGAITPAILETAGLGDDASLAPAHRAIDCWAPLTEAQKQHLKSRYSRGAELFESTEEKVRPLWIQRQCEAPRAGATCPGKPKIVLEPFELHSDHCLTVAIYAYFLADLYDANPDDAWLIGLCHHFHNAYLPDSGFSGEVLLADDLDQVITAFREKALQEVAPCFADRIRLLFAQIDTDETSLARAFHAADAIDRVLQMDHYARAAAFQTKDALVGHNLVHEGPVQAFQTKLLRNLGWNLGAC